MRLLLATIVALLLTSVPVRAATVTYTSVPGDRYTSPEQVIAVAGDGADDQLTATIGPQGIDLDDATAPLVVTETTAGLRNVCAAVDEHRVHCAVDPFSSTLQLDGGLGADRLAVLRPPGATPAYVQVAGGPGDDVLTGSDGGERFDGGPGRDVVRGLGGNDELKAATLDDGDVLDGGEGTDTLEVQGGGLVADLAAGGITGPGLAAALTSVEEASVDRGSAALGTNGPNRLRGGGRLLDGRGGDDEIDGALDAPQVLRGGEGDDTIYYAGADDVEAGPGDDVVKRLVANGRAHAVNCGPGTDEVDPAPDDVAARDCEWVSDGRFRLGNAARVIDGTTLRLTVSGLRPGCGVFAYATQPGVRGPITPVVRVRHRVVAGASFAVSLPLRASGRRLQARGLLRGPRIILRRPLRGCPAHGRWTGETSSGVRVRLAAG